MVLAPVLAPPSPLANAFWRNNQQTVEWIWCKDYMGDMIKTHTKSVNEKPQLVKKMQIIHKKGGGPT